MKALMILQTGKPKFLHKKSFCPVRNSYNSQIKFSNGAGFTPSEKLKCKTCGTSLTGFTLIELLLVAVIILILAGMNIPALSKQYNRLKLENCALGILSVSRFARQSAIAQSKTYRLKFNLNEKSYYLLRETQTPGEFEKISGRLARKFKVPSDISIDISRQEINFYPDGEYETVEILLTNPNNLRYRLVKSGAFDELEIRKEK